MIFLWCIYFISLLFQMRSSLWFFLGHYICHITHFVYIFRHIAGLNANRAKNIIEWREKNGPFINREQLKKVKGLGPKSFQQCAGFIRINQDYIRTFCRWLLRCTLLGPYQLCIVVLLPILLTCIRPRCPSVHSLIWYMLTVWPVLGTGNTAVNKISTFLVLM